MKYNRIFFFSFLIAAFVACSSASEEVIVTLQQAEQCMEVYPDSALNLLRKISCPGKLSGQERADYVLLLTQARDKNYMDMSADSSITFAIDYFKKKKDKSKYGKALYYYGRVLHGKRETTRAMKVYWKARRVLKDTKEYKIMGLMFANMSIFNRDQSLYDEAIHCCRQAISYYYQAKDTLGVAYAYQTMGTSFFLKQEMDSVYQCVMTSLQLLTNNPVRLKINGSKILGKMYCFEKQYLKAEKVFLRILDEEPDKDMFVLHYMSLGRLYQMMGRKQDAEKYLKLCLDSDNLFTSSEAYECLAKLAKADHDYEQALILKGRSDSLLYIAENDRKREALVQLQVKYQKEEFETELLQGKLEKRGLHILYLIVVILFSGIVYFFYARYGRVKLEVIQTRKVIEKNNKQIASYQSEIGVYKQQKNETSVQCKVEELSRKMKVLITENEKLRSKIDVSTLIKMLKNGEVLVEKLTPEEWDKIFDLVNSLYSNSLIKLKRECSQLTKHDIKLLTFLFLGFTTRELKILFDSKDNHTIFKAKMRLKERLKLTKDESVEDFLHKCQSDKLK
ncbi:MULTISPECIES: tetratricopeptide repeat protein [Bacteroides]|jgi:tetratricopeptide (TPR) repeat protein|uniref:tetratricopeptide repeat protein n=1 Tax=Bacteroides TaxID=816 RepID=UPI001F19FF84|nr:tetratricopeptide repeat protein [Bacteroides nordii]MCE8466778.1 tetratricopeptide repeat protein [Bacteroides nordii]UYU48397.1 tetratricopeptide repeat protein [Bacteroides nordii]